MLAREKGNFDMHKITQQDYQKYDLYVYSENREQGDVQNVVNILCEAHRDEVTSLHKMYRGLLDTLMHRLSRANHKAIALSIAIAKHNGKEGQDC